MKLNSRIFVAGHRGLAGSAIVRHLVAQGFTNIVTVSRGDLDLLDQARVNNFFAAESIEFVFLAAARVGGIVANSTFPVEFIYENLVISTNVIRAAAQNSVEKLIFLGSSCIYPKDSPQPIREESLLAGPLEPTNEAYAIAKIAGLKLCQSYYKQYGRRFISVMPTNLYGMGDNFHPHNSHVVPGLLRRFHEAKVNGAESVVVWGSGSPRREFLYVEDFAVALLRVMQSYDSPEIINLGSGWEVSIADLARAIKKVVGFKGDLVFDHSQPDGMSQKLLDSTKMRGLGWEPTVPLGAGIAATYAWALATGALFGDQEIPRSRAPLPRNEKILDLQ